MLRPARMCRMDCLMTDEHKDQVASRLHKMGVSEIEFLGDEFLEKNVIARDRPQDRVKTVSDQIIRARRMIDVLKQFERKKTGFVEDLLGVDTEPKKKTGDPTFNQLAGEVEDLLTEAEGKLGRIQEALAVISARKNVVLDSIKKYSPLAGLDFDLGYLGGSTYLYTVCGLIPRENLSGLECELRKDLAGCYSLIMGGGNEKEVPLVLSVPREYAVGLESLARRFSLNQIRPEGGGRLPEVVRKLEGELNESNLREGELNAGLAEIHEKYYGRLLVAEELLELEKQRCEVFIGCGRTGKITLMRLWVPERQCGMVESKIKSETENLCSITVERDLESAPILLENPPIVRSFEMLTRMFSMPRYNQIDPTLIIAPTFVLFFGIMLTDAVYGVLLVALAYTLNKKYGRHARGVRDMSVIIGLCGLSTILFGVLTGSYFGDFLGKYVLGGGGSKDVAVWLDPMYKGNAITVLFAACTIGVAHLFLGHLFGAYDKLRRGDFMGALTKDVSWYVLAAGLLTSILSKIPQNHPIPEIMFVPGVFMAVAAVIMILGGSGVVGVLELIGVVGNALSYARLLALLLTTAGTALAFNLLASMVFNIPYVGVLFAGIIFLAGHLINILMNTLGAFVHSLRLHYLEFFGTFYGGGGREFKPFKEERRYTIR